VWVLRGYGVTGQSVIPKSCKVHRLKENIDIFDFELDEADMVR